MIKIVNTKNLTGVTITGTNEDIAELYESIGRVAGSGLELEHDNAVLLRIQGVLYDLRHCLMGDREIEFVDNGYTSELQKYHGKIHSDVNVEFSVSIIWHEAMFAALALDDFVIVHEDDKAYKKKMDIPGLPEQVVENFDKCRYRDIAMVRLYQELMWEAFRDACGLAAYKRLRKKSKEGQSRYYKSMQYVGFITQYLTMLEMKYIDCDREKRIKLLATHVGKIIRQSNDYMKLSREVIEAAREYGVSVTDIRYSDEEWPEDLEW